LEEANRERARLKSSSDAITRERDDLKLQLETMRKNQQPTISSSATAYSLNEAQIHALADALFEVKNQLPASVDIQRVANDGESMSLSVQIGRAFDLASVQPLYNWGRPYTPRDTGIRIRVGDIKSIPDGAKKVADALRTVGIQSTFETLSGSGSGNFSIFVGPKP
jgi:hypothetical protein